MQESDEDRARVVTGVCGYVRKREKRFSYREEKGRREKNGGAEESVAGAN